MISLSPIDKLQKYNMAPKRQNLYHKKRLSDTLTSIHYEMLFQNNRVSYGCHIVYFQIFRTFASKTDILQSGKQSKT